MKLFLVSFANGRFKESQDLLNSSAIKNGVNATFDYSPEQLRKSSFYKKNKSILDQERGAGYWLWKPYIILESLKKMKLGDVLFYSDSGIQIISPIDPLVKIVLEKDIVLFSNDEHLNREYAKRDCFVLMGCDKKAYWDAKQIQASFQVYKKSKRSLEFVKKWLAYCCNEQILTDKSNMHGENFSDFVAHRHDQSILSLLSLKEHVEIFRDPSQWGNYSKHKEYRVFGEFLQHSYSTKPFTNSPYSQILNHHRNHLKVTRIKERIFLLRETAISLAKGILSFSN